jgi:hypothetical protein
MRRGVGACRTMPWSYLDIDHGCAHQQRLQIRFAGNNDALPVDGIGQVLRLNRLARHRESLPPLCFRLVFRPRSF